MTKYNTLNKIAFGVFKNSELWSNLLKEFIINPTEIFK